MPRGGVALLALACQTDMTRVSTFMAGKEVSNRAFPEIGIADSHHPLSHHQDDPGTLARLAKLNESHQDDPGTLARLAKLNEYHFAQFGGKDTGIRGGRYARYEKQPLTNLHITILEKMGYPVETLGDSTGTIQGLTDV